MRLFNKTDPGLIKTQVIKNLCDSCADVSDPNKKKTQKQNTGMRTGSQ